MENKIPDLETRKTYLKIGLAFAGIAIDLQTAEFVIRIYEGILEKGDKFSLKDWSKIKATCELKLEEEKS